MSAEASKTLIRRLFEEVLNGGNMDVVDEIISTEYVEHAALPGQEASGPEGVKQRLAIFRQAFLATRKAIPTPPTPPTPHDEAWRSSTRCLLPTASFTQYDLPNTACRAHFGKRKGYKAARNAPEGGQKWANIDVAARGNAK